MGMSTHVVGFRPVDAEWTRMRKIYDMCKEEKVSIPPEVEKFFDGVDPKETAGIEVELKKGYAVKAYHADMREGYEVDITKLPPEVKILRFYNSY